MKITSYCTMYILPQEDAVLYSRSILPMEDMTILPVEEKSIFILREDRSIISLYIKAYHRSYRWNHITLEDRSILPLEDGTTLPLADITI